ncbi:MAG: hypothetical protein B193_2659 [Solidesulfovibrio magneticus str. Maddingley MBC34]|uniref:Uncharacterized protein n=1 Tax=Solidesulfovibrio magneticus str. Maddingley MBC34 TaxID=1206767 RepID=K6GNT6_9BACT|nr:MAG: hypothetical protein B193_2659 [Solidesulfovibrio magneticus str. Maddingley MBC34]
MANHSMHTDRGRTLRTAWPRLLALAVLLAAGLTALPQAGLAKEDYSFIGVKKASQVPQFVASLQKALAADDKQAVAKLVSYPLMVSLGGQELEIENQAALVRQYDQVFTKAIRENILAQPLNDIFVNKQGVMVGSDGKVWALPEGNNLRICVIRDQ